MPQIAERQRLSVPQKERDNMALSSKPKSQADVIAEAMKDEVVVDFSGASEGFVQVDPGTYDIIVKAAESTVSKAGVPSVAFQFEITTPGPFHGEPLFAHCQASGKWSFFLRDTLAALGVTVKDGEVFKPSTTVGKRAIADVMPQKNNPKYNNVTLRAAR